MREPQTHCNASEPSPDAGPFPFFVVFLLPQPPLSSTHAFPPSDFGRALQTRHAQEVHGRPPRNGFFQRQDDVAMLVRLRSLFANKPRACVSASLFPRAAGAKNSLQLSSKPAPLVMAYSSFSRSTCWKGLTKRRKNGRGEADWEEHAPWSSCTAAASRD
jgi:hypothetical protein